MHTLRRSASRLVLFILLTSGLLPLAGCSRGPEFAEVEGTVTLDGKPLDNVEVVFLPDAEKGNHGASSSAYTAATGHYRLHCEKADKNGAVLGLHRVCVNDITAVAAPADQLAILQAAAEGKPTLPQLPLKSKPSRVPLAYSDASQTPLRNVEVKLGPQTLEFDVKSDQK